jgi:hypothetical protein
LKSEYTWGEVQSIKHIKHATVRSGKSCLIKSTSKSTHGLPFSYLFSFDILRSDKSMADSQIIFLNARVGEILGDICFGITLQIRLPASNINILDLEIKNHHLGTCSHPTQDRRLAYKTQRPPQLPSPSPFPSLSFRLVESRSHSFKVQLHYVLYTKRFSVKMKLLYILAIVTAVVAIPQLGGGGLGGLGGKGKGKKSDYIFLSLMSSIISLAFLPKPCSCLVLNASMLLMC